MSVAGFLGVVAAPIATILLAIVSGRRLIQGGNGRSLSKLQLLVWTGAAAVSFLLHLGESARRGNTDLAISASPNLLLLVGLSTGSYVAAGGILKSMDRGPEVLRRHHWRLASICGLLNHCHSLIVSHLGCAVLRRRNGRQGLAVSTVLGGPV